MAVFNDLPIELLPLILLHIIKTSHIVQVCLVNRTFDLFARPQLYARIFIYSWHKNVKIKVIKLFETFASCPGLAEFVQELTIRDFPVGLLLGDKVDFLELCARGVANCTNLRACSWTRDRSLSRDVLLSLLRLPFLTDLELNGRKHSLYNPDILSRFTNLRKISLIMPSGPVIDLLPAWIAATSATLEHLTLICQDAKRIDDKLLAKLAPSLTNLRYLYLVGCPRITHEGLWSVLSMNTAGLLGLGMEGLSSAFDMKTFSQKCLHLGALKQLQSITLTGPSYDSMSVWSQQVVNLLSSSPLATFHICTVGGEVGGVLNDDLCSGIVSAHGSRLRRFAADRMAININAIADICKRCTKLEQLFITADQKNIDALGSCLSHTRSLRSLHIKRPIGKGSESAPDVPRSQILSLVNQCGSELQQIGSNTRVWQVRREVKRADDGSLFIERGLNSYERPEVPEQFLVVRT